VNKLDLTRQNSVGDRFTFGQTKASGSTDDLGGLNFVESNPPALNFDNSHMRPNNQNKVPTHRMQNLKPVFSRRSP
jgi:hypothetical protein